MKSYNAKEKTAIKLDRIERAVELIEAGKVWKQTDGNFRVFTDRFAGAYTCTITACDCHDFTETLKGAAFCRHQWAAIGATAALLVKDIRKAESVKQLEAIGKPYAEAMKSLPAAFVRIARAEYKQKYKALRAKSRAEEEAAILVKPQLNGSRYGSIDVQLSPSGQHSINRNFTAHSDRTE